jgi:hypothetical protein
MLDPILSYAGGGELPTHKDAASILERYYFREEADGGVEINDKGEDGKGMEHAEGTGTEQAGTDDKGIAGAKKDAEKEIAKESKKLKGKAIREEEEKKEEEKKEEKEPKDEEKKDEEVAMENAIIEKLIAEMEEEDKKEPDGDEDGGEAKGDHAEPDGDEKEKVSEGDAPDYEGTGVKPGMEAPDEKEAKTSMDDAQGAGTQQAGTGDANGQVPDRKDVADSFTKPAQLEQEDKAEEKKEGDEEEEGDLDVDKAVKEGSRMPGAMYKKARQEDSGAAELNEIFRLFKEEIEAEAGDDDDESDAAEETDKEDESK